VKLFCYCGYTFQRAKERGAKIIKDIWEESDEAGRVRIARVQTVSILCITNTLLLYQCRTSPSLTFESLITSER
jgi:hypothetical protein